MLVRSVGGCAACGNDTEKRAVSPYEDVPAKFCDECQYLVTLLNRFVDPPSPTAQAALQVNTLRRLRRVEQVVGALIRSRMISTLVVKGRWEDIADALGMSIDQAKAKYPLPNSRPNSGWGT